MNKAVYLEHLSFSYPNTLILKDVTFHIEEGEFVGIIGPNGGGKTTLLKLLMGFLKPTSGKVEIFGQPPSLSRRFLAYVPQNLSFDRQFPISVLDLVLSGRLSYLPWHGQFRREDKTAALQALEEVDLIPFKDTPFGALSGGQAQRALIARALVSEPRLLLLDEATAGVDTQAEASIYHLLTKLRGKITILMVTHDLQIAIDHVERVLCVQNGVIPLNPQEVCEHFAVGLYHPPLINVNQ